METYRIAFCEDDALQREEIEKMIHEILDERKIKHEIALFSCAEELLEAMEQDTYHLLLLDIRLSGVSGMDLAKKLRQEEDRISIVFISAYEEYLREGYRVQPVDYLMKPVKREELARALTTDLKLNHQKKKVLFKKRDRMVCLPADEIYYIEASNHSVAVHMEHTQENFSLTMSEVERSLPPGSFGRCHNSYIVNMKYIRDMGRARLVLSNGEHLPVGRKFYKDFQRILVHYINH